MWLRFDIEEEGPWWECGTRKKKKELEFVLRLDLMGEDDKDT